MNELRHQTNPAMQQKGRTFTPSELEQAVTFGNVYSFYSAQSSSNEKKNRIVKVNQVNKGKQEDEKEEEEEKEDSSFEFPTNTSVVLSNKQRARIIEEDPYFPAKCKAFRDISDKHERIFFSWTEGQQNPSLSKTVGLTKFQLSDEVTLGRYTRRKGIATGSDDKICRTVGGDGTLGALGDSTNNSRVVAKRQLKYNAAVHSKSWAFGEEEEEEENKRKWHKEAATMVRSMIFNSSNLDQSTWASFMQDATNSSINNISSNSTNTHLRQSRRNKKQKATTPRDVRKMIKVATPKKLSSKRRRTLIDALLSFGVETFDDLKQFTFTELRNDRTLHAFTAPQLKRMLKYSKIDRINNEEDVNDEKRKGKKFRKKDGRSTSKNDVVGDGLVIDLPKTPPNLHQMNVMCNNNGRDESNKMLTPINEEDTRQLSNNKKRIASTNEKAVRRLEELMQNERKDVIERNPRKTIKRNATDKRRNFLLEEENTIIRVKKKNNNNSMVTSTTGNPQYEDSTKIPRKTLQWSFVAGFLTAFTTGALMLWMWSPMHEDGNESSNTSTTQKESGETNNNELLQTIDEAIADLPKLSRA
jgi:hypothetical protein